VKEIQLRPITATDYCPALPVMIEIHLFLPAYYDREGDIIATDYCPALPVMETHL
jgi:hypothetical protein